ncbi:hypothetical protein [Steroidobacter sp.]|uniref:hypothetical protein n=1 Tax=Steroidobacter sp. TaxID=1978227 RepID=UPI001A485D84|nr:hypothetical protein [Steroidobacter sp.]MBL8271497.1 hypothetical protein [Steroidobacter sp.]
MSQTNVLGLSKPVRGLKRGVWSLSELRQLRDLANQGLAPDLIAKALRRSEFAIRNKAGMHGIAFQRRPKLPPQPESLGVESLMPDLSLSL